MTTLPELEARILELIKAGPIFPREVCAKLLPVAEIVTRAAIWNLIQRDLVGPDTLWRLVPTSPQY